MQNKRRRQGVGGRGHGGLPVPKSVHVYLLGFLDPIQDLPALHRVSREWKQLVDDCESTHVRHISWSPTRKLTDNHLRWSKSLRSLDLVDAQFKNWDLVPEIDFKNLRPWLASLQRLEHVRLVFGQNTAAVSQALAHEFVFRFSETIQLRTFEANVTSNPTKEFMAKHASTLERLIITDQSTEENQRRFYRLPRLTFPVLVSLDCIVDEVDALMELLPNSLDQLDVYFPALTDLNIRLTNQASLEPLARLLYELQTSKRISLQFTVAKTHGSNPSIDLDTTKKQVAIHFTSDDANPADWVDPRAGWKQVRAWIDRPLDSARLRQWLTNVPPASIMLNPCDHSHHLTDEEHKELVQPLAPLPDSVQELFVCMWMTEKAYAEVARTGKSCQWFGVELNTDVLECKDGHDYLERARSALPTSLKLAVHVTRSLTTLSVEKLTMEQTFALIRRYVESASVVDRGYVLVKNGLVGDFSVLAATALPTALPTA